MRSLFGLALRSVRAVDRAVVHVALQWDEGIEPRHLVLISPRLLHPRALRGMDFLSSRNMTLVRNDSRKRRCCCLAITTRRREARRGRAGRFPLPRAGSAPLHNHFHLAPPLSLHPRSDGPSPRVAAHAQTQPSPSHSPPPLRPACRTTRTRFARLPPAPVNHPPNSSSCLRGFLSAQNLAPPLTPASARSSPARDSSAFSRPPRKEACARPSGVAGERRTLAFQPLQASRLIVRVRSWSGARGKSIRPSGHGQVRGRRSGCEGG